MSATAHERAVKRHAEALAELRKLFAVASEATPVGRKLDEHTDELRETLAAAIADRNATRARCGLTDRQWSAQGGACESDFDAPATPTEG